MILSLNRKITSQTQLEKLEHHIQHTTNLVTLYTDIQSLLKKELSTFLNFITNVVLVFSQPLYALAVHVKYHTNNISIQMGRTRGQD